jgi:hypothetical protein
LGSNTRPRLPQLGPFFRNLSMVCPSMHGQRPPFHMQRPNFQEQCSNFQMQKPQPQAHRPSVQQPSHQNVQQGPRLTAPTSQNALAQGSHNGRAYFKCGLTCHFAWQCPTRQAVLGARNQNKPQGQQNFMYGMVNHMTSDEAQQAQDVVLGMCFSQAHILQLFYLILEHHIHS